MSKFISENGGVLAVLGVCLVTGAAYMEWRINVNAADAIHAAGNVTPAQLADAVKDIASNTAAIEKLQATDERFEGKFDRIVDILLED
mgnify:CR=1 FL=1